MAAPAPRGVISKDWRGFKVAFPVDGQEYAVSGLTRQTTADLFLDVMTVLEAALTQRPLEQLSLCTRRSDQDPPHMSAATRSALAAVGPAEAVRQLQACALGMQRPRAGLYQPRTTAAAASLLLFVAAKGGHTAALHLAISIAPEAVAVPDFDGAIPLHDACSECHLEAMRVLLDAAPGSAAAANRLGFLPLHMAARAVKVTGGDNSSNTASNAVVGRELDVHAAAIGIMLAAAPQTITAADRFGELPLHLAARATRWSRSSAAVAALLAAAPATAQVASQFGRLPLHDAAWAAHPPTIRMLLAAFPAGAAARNQPGNYPLHIAAAEAARDEAEAAVRLLLQSVPEAAEARGQDGLLPLELALGRSTIQDVGARRAVARALISATPTITTLRALCRAGPERGWPLLPDAIIARAPLTAEEWDLVPFACPGLGRALPAALAVGQGRQLVHRLPRSDLIRLRTFALCLGRVQSRRLSFVLPPPLVQQMLCLSVDA
ncbi:hypothetical protein ABPG77_000430 [Micractinium sp. CCAP 211/92]